MHCFDEALVVWLITIKGVKQLWKLIGPVGRNIRLDTLHGTRLAIDSSIWLYQFTQAMRDKEGATLTNAHILGFLRRILKLLFWGIKPVFVFDGNVPELKKRVIVRDAWSFCTINNASC